MFLAVPLGVLIERYEKPLERDEVTGQSLNQDQGGLFDGKFHTFVLILHTTLNRNKCQPEKSKVIRGNNILCDFYVDSISPIVINL